MILCVGIVLLLWIFIINAEKVNKYKPILSNIFIVFFIILFSVINSNNADYINYKFIYSEIGDTYWSNLSSYNQPILYTFFNKLFNCVGFNFFSFRFIYLLVSYLILFITAKKVCGNINLFALLFILGPYLFENVQLKNFMGSSLLFCSIYLLSKESKKDHLLSVIVFIFAGLFHYIYFIFFPVFILWLLAKRIKFKIYIVYFIIGLVLLPFSFKSSFNYWFILFEKMPISLYSKVFPYLQGTGRNGYILLIIEIYMLFFICLFLKKYISKNKLKQCRIIDLAIYFCSSLFLTLPLYMFAADFGRIIRDILPILFAAFTICYNNTIRKRIKIKNKFNFCIASLQMICYISLFIIFDTCNSYYGIVAPFFYID